MRGYPVHEYSSDKLSGMTEEEINQAICHDLYVNAYSDNEKSPVMYKGKRLAENLETVLYVCPRCGKIAALKSKGDMLECTCGLSLLYNAYGCFESTTSEKAPFKTILEWDKWQISYFQNNAEYYRSFPADKPIITDPWQSLYQFEAGSSTKFIGKGNLSLYSDRLVLEDSSSGKSTIFPLSEITDMALIQQTLLTFTVGGRNYYEVKSRHPRSGLKYLMLCKCLTELRIML
jgi:DNA-directed RNA polymerase subunit RPC12/RpoP